MGLRYRKSIKVAPGVKVNLNRKSASVSVGGKGFHKTFNSNGQTTTSVNLPVKGLSYTSRTSGSAATAGSHAASSYEAEDVTAAPVASDKSRSVACLLCVFLGFFGAHYFYVRRWGMGILYFCTAGVVGIGWIYDIFRILSGRFFDSDGAVL